MITAEQELRALARQAPRAIAQASLRLTKAIWDRSDDVGPARDHMSELLQRLLLLSDMLGRRRGMMEVREAMQKYRGAKFAASLEAPIITGVKFNEAIEQILKREPKLAWGWQEATRKYTHEFAFTLAKSMEGIIDEKVAQVRLKMVQKALISEDVQRGGMIEFRKAMTEIGPWSNQYADTVYRTNMSTAYTEGRFSQVKDPDVAAVIGALEVTKSTASNPDPTHKPFEGLLAEVNDPIWEKAKPPYRWGCTHGVRFVSIFELERRGRVKNGKVIPYYPPGLQQAINDPTVRKFKGY